MCLSDGCSKPIIARGFCMGHYNTVYRKQKVSEKCSVRDCDMTVKARSLCSRHLRRLGRHGDVSAGRTPNGSLKWFFENVVIPFTGDDCLRWPYSTDRSGRAFMKHEGRTVRVSRIACEFINGPPPSSSHVAAHLCGMGHAGCVNPRHLKWATQSENLMDRVAHNTHTRGQRSAVSKLTDDEARDIKARLAHHSVSVVASHTGVSYGIVYHIKRGTAWAWIDE